jgi:hypothetical protein
MSRPQHRKLLISGLANAAWGDSVEAKVCNAAMLSATFPPITVKGSGKKY